MSRKGTNLSSIRGELAASYLVDLGSNQAIANWFFLLALVILNLIVLHMLTFLTIANAHIVSSISQGIVVF